MARANKRKDSTFEQEQTKAVFLYGRPNLQKRKLLQDMERLFLMLTNHAIEVLCEKPEYTMQLVKNNAQNTEMRKLEKTLRPKDINSAFCQIAFDYAVVRLSNRLENIRKNMRHYHNSIFTKIPELFALAIMETSKQDMYQYLVNLQNQRKYPYTLFTEGMEVLTAMPEDTFAYETAVFMDTYAMLSLEYKMPVLKRADIPMDSRIMRLEKSEHIQMPYVLTLSNPMKKGMRFSVPVNTSKHGLHKIQCNDMAKSVYVSTKNGVLRVSWSYTKKMEQPKTSTVVGVDVGITDAFCTSDNKHIGTMKDVTDFYHKKVEPAFAEISSLRNKKRAIHHYLQHHDLPAYARRSLIQKMDRLEHMIQVAEAPYRKKRHYYGMLEHEIHTAVQEYIASIDQKTLTVLEQLDIKEFNNSRRQNAKFSMFARGKLQKKLMETLNWKGYDFIEVIPDYTSQVCPVCGCLNPENRNGKDFTCKYCGHHDDADHVGALNIKVRATDEEILNLCKQYKYTKWRLQKELKALLLKRHEEYKQQNCQKPQPKQDACILL